MKKRNIDHNYMCILDIRKENFEREKEMSDPMAFDTERLCSSLKWELIKMKVHSSK